MAKNPVVSGTIETYITDYNAQVLNQIRYKFVGEPGTDQDNQFPRILGGQICFAPSTDAQVKCLPRRSPIDPRYFTLTFNNATHKMPVADGDPGNVRTCGTNLTQQLGLLRCIGYKGETVRNLQLLVRP